MIFVAGTMTMDPGVIEEFEKDVAALRPKSLAEAGCHHYSLLVEDPASGLVNVLEIWDDDAKLAAHLKQPWTAEFFAKYVAHLQGSTLQVYDIAGSRPLPGL
jgi:quinol monooxygenase YgiN